MSGFFDSDRLGIQFGVAPDRGVPVADPGTPFRIAVLGDFSARSSRGSALRDVGDRSPVLVDRDNLDDIMARLRPELRLRGADDGPAEVVPVTSLDDLHPDTLYDRLPSLSALRDLRARVSDPATSSRAIQQLLGGTGPVGPAPATPRSAPAAAPAPSGGSLLEAIVTEAAGPEPYAQVHAQPAPVVVEDELSRFVRRVVSAHVVDPGDPRQGEVLAGIDASIAERMRVVLHDPGFQALEALWRGLQLLVRRLETGPDLKVFLVDVTRDELAADLAGDRALESTGLYRLLVDGSVGTPGAAPWAVLVGCYDFAPAGDDLRLLARLGGVAQAAGAPWISAATPALAGYSSFEETPEPESWSAPASPEWDALRRQPVASYLGLVAPRFLERLPYGADADECERFRFEELTPSPLHDELLWGNGAIAAAVLLGEAFTDDGWSMRPGSRAELTGLPLHIIQGEGSARAIPCAESLMPERTAARIMDAGVMPLASLVERDAVRLVRFQSIAHPLARLAGRWYGDRR